ncbi:MAG: glycosyltransferase family 2 protein [Candidatus Odinarchaeota archaeon]|nr:glycosyltransferase family 2 protein [Candidatus Odinarchaeota archaeon]
MIDVIMITKNSATHTPVFEKSLRSIYREIPVNRLIVVDAFSEDDTLKILEKLPRVEIHQIKGNRAVARQYGIKQVKTEWFMFVDDDVILRPNWFKIAQKYMTPDVGLIWGWDVIANPHARNRMKVMYYLRRKSEYQLARRNFDNRGGLHDTLIRTRVVKDIEIPSDLHVYEDWYIKRYVEQKGYRCLAPKDLWCYHYLNPKYNLQSLAQIAKLQKKYGVQSGLVTIRNLILAIPKSTAIFLISGDLRASIDQLKIYVYNFVGRFLL